MLENARSKSRQKRRLHRPFVPSAESSYSQVVQINKLFARSHPCYPNIASSCRLRPGIFPDNSNRTCDPSDADQLDANPLILVRNCNNHFRIIHLPFNFFQNSLTPLTPHGILRIGNINRGASKVIKIIIERPVLTELCIFVR